MTTNEQKQRRQTSITIKHFIRVSRRQNIITKTNTLTHLTISPHHPRPTHHRHINRRRISTRTRILIGRTNPMIPMTRRPLIKPPFTRRIIRTRINRTLRNYPLKRHRINIPLMNSQVRRINVNKYSIHIATRHSPFKPANRTNARHLRPYRLMTMIVQIKCSTIKRMRTIRTRTNTNNASHPDLNIKGPKRINRPTLRIIRPGLQRRHRTIPLTLTITNRHMPTLNRNLTRRINRHIINRLNLLRTRRVKTALIRPKRRP